MLVVYIIWLDSWYYIWFIICVSVNKQKVMQFYEWWNWGLIVMQISYWFSFFFKTWKLAISECKYLLFLILTFVLNRWFLHWSFHEKSGYFFAFFWALKFYEHTAFFLPSWTSLSSVAMTQKKHLIYQQFGMRNPKNYSKIFTAQKWQNCRFIKRRLFRTHHGMNNMMWNQRKALVGHRWLTRMCPLNIDWWFYVDKS